MKNEGYKVEAVPSKGTMMMQAITDDIFENVVSMALLYGLVSGCTWIRVLMGLQVTETFGPLITAINRMSIDIFTFFIFYLFQLFAFSVIASMTFANVAEFDGIYHTCLYMFNATLGDYDFHIFDVYESFIPTYKYLGHAFIIIYLMLNLILLLNMVIAMMSETYANMNSERIGIYNYQILRVRPQYKFNKYYGGMVASIPPFNILNFLVSFPLYILWRNDLEKVKGLTKFVLSMNFYLFVLPLHILIFTVCNLVILPFAYLKTIVAKMILTSNGLIPASKVLVFIAIGIPQLLILQVYDLINFVKWTSDTKDRDKK